MKPTPAQLENLKKGKKTQFNSETGRIAGKKGWEAAQEAKARNKAVAEFAHRIAEADLTNEELRKMLTDLGMTDEQVQNDALIAVGLFQRAIKGEVIAIEKWEELMDRAEANLDKIENKEARALALARAHYLENINSTFGAISVYALKHRYTMSF